MRAFTESINSEAYAIRDLSDHCLRFNPDTITNKTLLNETEVMVFCPKIGLSMMTGIMMLAILFFVLFMAGIAMTKRISRVMPIIVD